MPMLVLVPPESAHDPVSFAPLHVFAHLMIFGIH